MSRHKRRWCRLCSSCRAHRMSAEPRDRIYTISRDTTHDGTRTKVGVGLRRSTSPPAAVDIGCSLEPKRVPMARNGKSAYARRAPCTSKGMSSFAGPQIPLTLSGARTLTDGVAVPHRVGRKLSARRIVLSHRQQNRRTACPVRLDIPSGSRCLSPMIRQNHVGFLGEEAVATPSHLSHPTG